MLTAVIAVMTLLLLTVPAAADEPRTFGTTSSVSYTLSGFAFSGLTPEDNSVSSVDALGGRSCSGVRDCTFAAHVSLPAGALVTNLELETCNSRSTAFVFASLIQSRTHGSGVTSLGFVSDDSATVPNCQRFVGELDSHTINNASNIYFVRVQLSDLTTNLTANTRVQAVRIFYRLQVSSPGLQSFTDVPPSHPFYPFIQALAASGITGGCQSSPPMFCPDAHVTREQMAAFLARALGLHWAP